MRGANNHEAVGHFTATHWSLVLAAREKDTPSAAAALERLCHNYWPPLYAYIRRDGHSVEDAQDLTQEFLSRFLHRDGLDQLKDQNGKFRSFLLTCLKHFLSDQRDRANAQKRGGGQTPIALDAYEAEERDAFEPADGMTPDQVYERRWACAVMDAATRRLREEYARLGKTDLFEQLKDLQPGEHGEKSYAEIGAALGLSEQAMKNARHAFNRRYAKLLREEIGQTLEDSDELEAEVQHLMQVFAR
jgi:RNA polymerase sigma-70 factor (ECF subfamily)